LRLRHKMCYFRAVTAPKCVCQPDCKWTSLVQRDWTGAMGTGPMWTH